MNTIKNHPLANLRGSEYISHSVQWIIWQMAFRNSAPIFKDSPWTPLTLRSGVLVLTCTYRFIYCRKCAPHALATNISRIAACIFKSKWYKEIQLFYHAEVTHAYVLFLLSVSFLWHVITAPAPQSFEVIWYEWPTLCRKHYHDNLPCDVVTETLTKEMLIYLELSSSI